MNNVDLLLLNELNDNKTILTIDELSRAIKYDGKLSLGVEGDYKAEQIFFEIPKTIIMDEEVDISSDNVEIFIKFQNGLRDTYTHQCVNKTVKTKTLSDDTTMDYVEFSWLLTERVTVSSGVVSFMVCLKRIETDDEGADRVVNEWHTTPFEGTVEKSIKVTDDTPEIITDETATTSQLIRKVEELEVIVQNADLEYINNALSTKVDKTELDAKANQTDLDKTNANVQTVFNLTNTKASTDEVNKAFNEIATLLEGV